MQKILIALLLTFIAVSGAHAQLYDELGNDVGGMNNDGTNLNGDRGNFNPHKKDTTSRAKKVPKRIYVWTVDRKLGDIIPAMVDTLPHLFTHTTLNTGLNGEYNTLGSNYTPRQHRIFIDRPTEAWFPLIDAYSYMNRHPDQVHFTNTLSPITNLWYDNCGDNTNGEDHLDAKFAVNAGKRLGLGFDINYAYARGYYQNQSNSHFCATLFGSYLGDRYQAHLIFSTNHQKAAENGGIPNDNYVTHPDLMGNGQAFSENEIPTVLSSNWNRDHNTHFFFTHRYNVGFYRDVPMTEEEIKAREFAEQSKKEKDAKKKKEAGDTSAPAGRPDGAPAVPMGRPDGAKIAGDAPEPEAKEEPLDTTRISVTSQAMADSLLATEAKADTLASNMKKEFVPVTSFIHTLELDHFDHTYLAYATPANYYADTFYKIGASGWANDSISDDTRHLNLKNTVGIGLLEGFNKYAKAGLKAFATHQLRRYDMIGLQGDTAVKERWTEHNVSVGGRLSKTQGRTLHYNLAAEVWLAGADAGQLRLDGQADVNFALFGDTVRLAAKAYFYRLNADFLFRHFHSKHLWWDNDDLTMTTRTRIEGNFSYAKTKTRLRVALEEMQNYTYLGMSYTATDAGRTGVTARVMQHTGNINVMTAQLEQQLRLGPLHWDNILTYQSSSNQDALPLPKLNVFSNLYLAFCVARVLNIELGAAATYFTKYEAPDFYPALNQFAVQQNAESRVTLGNQPFVDVYANLHLKHARFFVMMTNLTGKSMNRMNFLTPHYPLNNSVLHIGVSWNFFN